MRSTDIRSVPSSGSTLIDFFIGPQGVGAVVVHNASYRTLTLTLTNGISRVIAANRSDLVTVGQATFDGHVTLTPGPLVAAQTDAGSVWVDVYLPGERVDGAYPAPCANAMTGGNLQPRIVTVPIAPAHYNLGSVGPLTANARALLDTWPASSASWPLDATAFATVYLYYLRLVPFLVAATSLQFIIQIQAEAQRADNTVIGGPIVLYQDSGLAALQGTTVANIVPVQYQPSNIVIGAGLLFVGTQANPLHHINLYVKLISSSTVSLVYTTVWGVDGQNATGFPGGIGEQAYITGSLPYTGEVF